MDNPILVGGVDQSALPFCDVACFHTFTFYQPVDDLVGGKPLKPNKAVCFHCAGCGRIIYESSACVLHDIECPEYLWYAAYPVMSEFLTMWAFETGDTEIAPDAWELANRISVKNPLICGSELAKLTLLALEQ